MDFSFTEEQNELAALTRRILDDQVTYERLRDPEGGTAQFDRALLGQLATTGLLGAALPEDVGGGGGGVIEQCLVLVELGRAVAAVPVVPSIVMAAMPIAEFGSAEQRKTWAEPAVQGAKILTAALVEEQDPIGLSPRARAERSGTVWSLHGAKTTVPAGAVADAILVPAITDAGPTVFVVEPADPGVQIVPQETTGLEPDAWLGLDGVEVPADRVLGEEGAGAEIVRWIQRRATLGVCALQLGVIERALELTAAYARERVQFDRPIGSFQAVAQRLADSYIDVEALRLTLWQAAWRLADGLPCDTEIATAKFWAAESGHRVGHTAVHVHGGTGIDLDNHVHRYFTAAKRNEFALGAATVQLLRIGDQLVSSGG